MIECSPSHIQGGVNIIGPSIHRNVQQEFLSSAESSTDGREFDVMVWWLGEDRDDKLMQLIQMTCNAADFSSSRYQTGQQQAKEGW